MIVTVLAGCGGGSNEGQGEETTVRTDLNLVSNGKFRSTDPQLTNTIVDRYVFWQVYEGLTFYNELTASVDPQLASSWDISEDGTVYTFHLRDDVYFHNGEQMKASDVVFSLNRSKQEEMPISTNRKCIADVKALDDYTVEVTLNAPTAQFLVNLCYTFMLSEKEVTEQGETFGTGKTLAGTGPYMYEEVVFDEKIVLTAFDKYYGGEAPIKTVNYLVMTDSAAAALALEGGQIDWLNVGVTDYQRLEADANFGHEVLPTGHITYLMFNPNSAKEPLQNEKVRQAMAYAIDKEALNLLCYEGYAKVADFFEDPDYNVAAPKHDVTYSYDPEKAKSLLAEAGYADGCDVGEITCFTGNYFEVLVTAVQSQWKEVGINVELKWVDQSALQAICVGHDYDICANGMGYTGDYSDYVRRCEGSAAFLDYAQAGYDADFIHEKFAAGSAEPDTAKRTEIYKAVDEYVASTATYIPIFHRSANMVWNSALKPLNRPSYYRISEWSWI